MLNMLVLELFGKHSFTRFYTKSASTFVPLPVTINEYYVNETVTVTKIACSLGFLLRFFGK